jgi:hypothetical protein
MDHCKELVRKAGGTVREDMSRFFGCIGYACVLSLCHVKAGPANISGGSLCRVVWKIQLKKMMRRSKAKSALTLWAKTGLERGVIVWVELAVFRH